MGAILILLLTIGCLQNAQGASDNVESFADETRKQLDFVNAVLGNHLKADRAVGAGLIYSSNEPSSTEKNRNMGNNNASVEKVETGEKVETWKTSEQLKRVIFEEIFAEKSIGEGSFGKVCGAKAILKKYKVELEKQQEGTDWYPVLRIQSEIEAILTTFEGKEICAKFIQLQGKVTKSTTQNEVNFLNDVNKVLQENQSALSLIGVPIVYPQVFGHTKGQKSYAVYLMETIPNTFDKGKTSAEEFLGPLHTAFTGNSAYVGQMKQFVDLLWKAALYVTDLKFANIGYSLDGHEEVDRIYFFDLGNGKTRYFSLLPQLEHGMRRKHYLKIDNKKKPFFEIYIMSLEICQMKKIKWMEAGVPPKWTATAKDTCECKKKCAFGKQLEQLTDELEEYGDYSCKV